MAHIQQRNFIQKVKNQFPGFFFEPHVIEIGSLNINGTVRDFFSDPTSYLGLDLIEGKDVDLVCPGNEFQSNDKEYDVAISTECFEHDKHWIETFLNMHRLVHEGGLVVFTCASTGRHEHGTTRTSPQDSPATTDYYHNVSMKEFMDAIIVEDMFSSYSFEYNAETCDLYFWGIKK